MHPSVIPVALKEKEKVKNMLQGFAGKREIDRIYLVKSLILF